MCICSFKRQLLLCGVRKTAHKDCGVRKFGSIGTETSFLSPKWGTNAAVKRNLATSPIELPMLLGDDFYIYEDRTSLCGSYPEIQHVMSDF